MSIACKSFTEQELLRRQFHQPTSTRALRSSSLNRRMRTGLVYSTKLIMEADPSKEECLLELMVMVGSHLPLR
jgi:hypothetical protein